MDAQRDAGGRHPLVGARARESGLSQRRSGASGAPSACSRTARRRSSCRAIRTSWTRSAGLYLSPPDRALVLCVDDQIQALDRSRSCRCCRACPSAAHTLQASRHDLALRSPRRRHGPRHRQCCRRHRAREFLDFLKEIDRRVPDELDIHIVMDDYATHKTGGQGVAGAAAALACSLYADGVLDQPGRTLRSPSDAQAVAARRAHLHPPARSRYPGLHGASPSPSTKLADDILAAVKRFKSKLMPRTLAR